MTSNSAFPTASRAVLYVAGNAGTSRHGEHAKSQSPASKRAVAVVALVADDA